MFNTLRYSEHLLCSFLATLKSVLILLYYQVVCTPVPHPVQLLSSKETRQEVRKDYCGERNETSCWDIISVKAHYKSLPLLFCSALLVRSCFQTPFSGLIESSASEEPLLNVYGHLEWSPCQTGFVHAFWFWRWGIKCVKSTTDRGRTVFYYTIGPVDQFGWCSGVSVSRNYRLFEDILEPAEILHRPYW